MQSLLTGLFLGLFFGAYFFNLKVRHGVNSFVKAGFKWLKERNFANYAQKTTVKGKDNNGQKSQ